MIIKVAVLWIKRSEGLTLFPPEVIEHLNIVKYRKWPQKHDVLWFYCSTATPLYCMIGDCISLSPPKFATIIFTQYSKSVKATHCIPVYIVGKGDLITLRVLSGPYLSSWWYSYCTCNNLEHIHVCIGWSWDKSVKSSGGTFGTGEFNKNLILYNVCVRAWVFTSLIKF